MDTWVHQMIRTRSRRRVAAWGLVLACAVAFLISEHRYIRNFLLGPFPLAQADLDAIDDVEAAPRYFVRVTGSKAIDTGLQQITTRMRKGVETGGSVSASYYPSLDRRGGAQADVSNPASPSLQYAGDASDPAALLSVLRRQRVVSPARLYRPTAVLLVLAALIVVLGSPAWKYRHDVSAHHVRRPSPRRSPLGIQAGHEAQRELHPHREVVHRHPCLRRGHRRDQGSREDGRRDPRVRRRTRPMGDLRLLRRAPAAVQQEHPGVLRRRRATKAGVGPPAAVQSMTGRRVC